MFAQLRDTKLYKAAALSLAAGLVLGSQAAWADSPHFIKATAFLQGTNLECSFKEAGLGTNQTVLYVCEAQAEATYVCVNNGSANPSANNKESVSGPVSGQGSFNSGKNGQITASVSIAPPSALSFTCPPGQSRQLAEATFTQVVITDTTNDVSQSIPGTFTTGCLLPNVRGACD